VEPVGHPGRPAGADTSYRIAFVMNRVEQAWRDRPHTMKLADLVAATGAGSGGCVAGRFKSLG